MSSAPGLQRNQSLQRGVALLRAVAEHPQGAPARELASAAGLPLPTARRLLATLDDAGLVEHLPQDGRWVLGRELIRLARAADPHAAVALRARRHLVELAAATGETAMLAASRLPHGIDVIAQADGPGQVRIASWIGRAFPLHASVGARVALAALPDADVLALVGAGPYPRLAAGTLVASGDLLAALREVRADGVAEGADELEDGLATVAVAVGAGDPHGLSIGLHGPSSRLHAARRRAVVPALRATAAAIARELAG